MTYLGIDIGTSGCKASVMDQKGKTVKSAIREYKMTPAQNTGYAALDLNAVWAAAKEVILELAPFARDICAVTVASIGETLVMLDGRDRIVFEGITYADSRNHEMWDVVRSNADEGRLAELSGAMLPQIASLNQYLWWRRNEPKQFGNVKKIMHVGSFITYCLSGEMGADYSIISSTMLYDIQKMDWAYDVADKFDVNLELFPGVYAAGTVLGTIKPDVAEELGLPATAKVLVGCHDQISATAGAGVIADGDAALGEGSTEALNLLVGQETVERFIKSDRSIHYEPFLEPGRYVVMLSQLTHGTALRWFVTNFERALKAQCEQDGTDVYEAAGARCAADCGDIYFLPYLSKAYFPDTKGMALGTFIGLELGVTTKQMYRALLEGLCFETKKKLELLREKNVPLSSITATGGASKSALYMQMKADITGYGIRTLDDTQSGVRGLGMICAVGCGHYRNYREAAEAFVTTKRTFIPQKGYDQKYQNYVKISDAVRKLGRELKNE